MNRELVRGTTMLLLVVAVALVTAVASANAQSRLSADVPFEFVANNQTLSAGQYNISDLTTTGRDVVRISNLKQEKGVFALTIRLTRNADSEKGKLVFHRYGNRYFLTEIWPAGNRDGRKLHRSKEEKAIQNEMAAISSKTALPQRTYERVEIALVRN